MGESVLYDVLSVIRQKQREADMDIKPSKRIFGTDMEHPDTTKEYLKDMEKRIKIKEKLRAARERRKARLEELEKGMDKQPDGESPSSDTINIPLTGKLSMGDVVKEYIARRGKSVKLQEHSNRVLNSPSESADNRQELKTQTESVDQNDTNYTYECKGHPSTSNTPIEIKEDPNKLVVTVDIEYSGKNDTSDIGKAEDRKHQDETEKSNAIDNGELQDTKEKEKEYKDTTEDSSNKKVEQLTQNHHTDSDHFSTAEESTVQTFENKEENFASEKDKSFDEEKKPKSSKASKKWKKAKLLPIALAATKLKQKMDEENKKQLEFLETLRLLRGISRDEFYKDIKESSSDEDDETSDEEEDDILNADDESQEKDGCESETEQPSPTVTSKEDDGQDECKDNATCSVDTNNDFDAHEQNENQTDSLHQGSEKNIGVKEVKFRKKKANKKKITPGCRIDTRWPVGHRLHTRPDLEMIHLTSQNSKPRNGQTQRPKIANHSKRSILEYEHWREQLLQIAYLKEFDHVKGKSLREFSLPLPDIYTQKRNFTEKEYHSFGIKSLDSLSSRKSDQSCFSDPPLSSRSCRKKRFRRRSQTIGHLIRDSNKIPKKKNIITDNASQVHADDLRIEKDRSTEPLYELVRTAVEDVQGQDIISDEDNYSDRDNEGEESVTTTYSQQSLRSVKSQSSDSAINEPSNHSDLEDDSMERLSEPQSIPIVRSKQIDKISVDDYRSLIKPDSKSREDRVMENLYQLRANRYKSDPDHPESRQKNRNRKTIDRSKMRKRTELLPLFSSYQRKSTKMSPRVWNND